jgi:hypothetical protein
MSLCSVFFGARSMFGAKKKKGGKVMAGLGPGGGGSVGSLSVSDHI